MHELKKIFKADPDFCKFDVFRVFPFMQWIFRFCCTLNKSNLF